MRFSELTDQERAALIEEFVPLRVENLTGSRGTQRSIAVCFAAAGFCAFGCIQAIATGRTLSAAAMLFSFALGSAYFFGTAWAKLMAYNTTVKAGERAYLLLVFERCAKHGVEFSTQDVANFLRYSPDLPR